LTDHLISPHGGTLNDLCVSEERTKQLAEASRDWPSYNLKARQLCDLELLMNGGFSPLRGFMGSADHESVCTSMRLSDGTLWPLPITLDVPEAVAQAVGPGATLALRDPEGVMLAALHVEEVWQPDRQAEAECVFGSLERGHPGVIQRLEEAQPYSVAGAIEGIELPGNYDFPILRRTPAELRAEFARLGWRRVVAFHARAPMHRAQQEATLRAAKEAEASLLIHAAVGLAKPDDREHYTRIRCYEALLRHFPRHTAMLSLLNVAPRMAGPREALLHAIVHKNHGCTHLIVERDHAGPGSDANGKPYYGPEDAQQMVKQHEGELGVEMVTLKRMVYVEDQAMHMAADEVPEGSRTLSISAAELGERLADGREVPEWFSFPEVVNQLRHTRRPRHRQGFTVFFTGLSGAGKSTIANVLLVKFLEMGGRPVTLLDGDIVRKHLSSELGFSREHRDINIRRIGFVASEITKNGGIAICAPIAPYDSVRQENRAMIEPLGGYILVYVDTPLTVCEERDRKGLYAKARAGIVKEFTGVSDPYEVPEDADVVIDTTDTTPEEGAQKIILHLEKAGYIGSSANAS
jgi:sulfate adenylyltransferase